MRLTLRTLLAYLDQTLDRKDAETLQKKIDGNPVATELTNRIAAAIADPNLGAASPDAVSPIHNANVISEYLDNTLSHQQIAEIERVCLESATSLAEAAACHQIIAAALHQPAVVGDSLRQRLKSLPGSEAVRQSTAGNAEASAAPSQPDAAASDSQPPVATTAAATPAAAAAAGAPAMASLGPGDSGVTRSPLAGNVAQPLELGQREEAELVAGTTRRALAEPDGGGGGLAGRLAPWIIALAIAGLILLAVSKVFDAPRGTPVAVVPPSVDGSTAELPTAEPTQARPSKATPPGPPVEAIVTADLETPVKPPADPPTPPAAIQKEPAPIAMDPPSSQPTSPPPAVQTSNAEAMASAETEPPVGLVEPMIEAKPETAPEPTDPLAATQPPVISPPVTPPPAESSGPEVAVLETPETLLLARTVGAADRPGQWSHRQQNETVRVGESLVVSSKFDATLQADVAEVRLVGPTTASFVDDSPLAIRLRGGRLVIRLDRAGGFGPEAEGEPAIVILTDSHRVRLMPAAGPASVAVEFTHLRPPGLDPTVPENRQELIRITAVDAVQIAMANGEGPFEPPVTLQPLDQWERRESEPVQTRRLTETPAWIEQPAGDDDLLSRFAREGVLEFVNRAAADPSVVVELPPGADKGDDAAAAPTGEGNLRKRLLEATTFRRTEVVGLAAETLMMIGDPSAYFGPDGLFNRPRQSVQWTEHFRTLQRYLGRDVEAAGNVMKVLENELSDKEDLRQLLVGFTAEQLASGADETLVQRLDSGSMAVRVLALENLRLIVGESLGFRPEQENAGRRAGELKAWQTRLRRGDIRAPSP